MDKEEKRLYNKEWNNNHPNYQGEYYKNHNKK